MWPGVADLVVLSCGSTCPSSAPSSLQADKADDGTRSGRARDFATMGMLATEMPDPERLGPLKAAQTTGPRPTPCRCSPS